MSFKAEQGVKFLPPTKLKKIVRPRVKLCPPTGTSPPTVISPNGHLLQLALPPTGTFLNFFLCY